MDLERFLSERLKRQREKGFAPDFGYVTEGCGQLYEATGVAAYRQFIFDGLERIKAGDFNRAFPETKRFQAGKILFFLYRETGEERYRILIEQLRKELTCDFSDTKKLYEVLPFYMEYETMFHNKAEYGEIVRQFAKGRTLRGGTHWYLLALANAMEHMSIEIFEHYESLRGIFKETIRDAAADEKAVGEGRTPLRDMCIGCAVIKACAMELLNAEKYLEAGQRLVDGAIEKAENNPQFLDGDAELGIFLTASAVRQ